MQHHVDDVAFSSNTIIGLSDPRSIRPSVYRTLFDNRSIGPSVYRTLFLEKGPIDRFKIGLSDPRSKGPFSIIGLSDPRSIGPFPLKKGPIDRFKSDPRS